MGRDGGPGRGAGIPTESAFELRLADVSLSAVRVGSLGLVDLLPVGPFDVLVDARHLCRARADVARYGYAGCRGMMAGRLGRMPVITPRDGLLRGMARDGREVPEGAEIVEVDTRNRWRARWIGVDDEAARVADAITRALALHHCVVGTPH